MVGSNGVYLRKDLRWGVYPWCKKKMSAADWFKAEEQQVLTYQAWCRELAFSKAEGLNLTYSSYRHKLEKYVFPTIGMVPLQQLDCFMLAHLIRQWQQWGVDYFTMESLTGLISRTLDYAVQMELLTENPCEKTLRQMTKIKMQALPLEKQTELEELAEKSRSQMLQAAVIALHTGLRGEEIAELTWENIDFHHQLIYVAAKHPEAATASRTVSMPPNIAQLFHEIKDTAEDTSQRVFPQAAETWELQWITAHFHEQGASSHDTRIYFEQLRYTFTKHYLENTGDLTAVSALLGEWTPSPPTLLREKELVTI